VCGIAGIVGTSAADSSRIAAMLDTIRHRGPDDEGVVHTKGATLGHRRLSIIDLTGGHQPMANADESLWLVFNGEIYNYRDQRERLESAGHQFRTQSDSEVLIGLYAEHGVRCVDFLRGMFAFAIWDTQRQEVFLARDHLGQKPLYYAKLDNQFIFSSEIKGLLAAAPELAELDPEALDQYFSLRVIASPRSMFRRIRKLPPGHSLTFSRAKGLEVRRYWKPDYEPKHAGSDAELVDALEAEVIDSLRHHMISDVPVGAFMSGGLDSTLVVAMLMKHVVDQPLRTFSMGLPYRQFDEAPYARMVAERYGTAHHERVETPSLIAHLPTLVWHLDEPSDPLSVCSYLIAGMAREEVKVVVGGDGGDELFGGYDRYYGNRYASYYARLPESLRRLVIGPVLKHLPDGRWYKAVGHQLKWLHRLSFLSGAERYAASLGYFYFRSELREAIYGPEMQDRLATLDPYASIREPFDAARARDLLDQMLYADTQVRLPDHSVMILDRMTMAHSLEARSPFMDHRLAEFSARLPVRMKVRGRSLRYIQYRLAERYLPDEVIRRPKQGFSSALPYMLRDEYAKLNQSMLQRSELASDGLLNQQAIDALVDEQKRGKADHGNRLWLLINAEIWYRMFLKGQSRDDLSRQLAA
jgi:asparagine synthase (glutamine-hydrolysing)